MRNEIRIETDFGKPWDAVTIGDLREWHTLYVRCQQCDRRAELNPLRLTRRYRPYALLVDVQRNLPMRRMRQCHRQRRRGGAAAAEYLGRDLAWKRLAWIR